MKADASLMQHKIEILNKQLSMQENEVANLGKRVDTKNNLIGALEEKIGEITKKISDLQDEVLSLKLHDCRIANQTTAHHRREWPDQNQGKGDFPSNNRKRGF